MSLGVRLAFDPFRVGIIPSSDPWALPTAINSHAFSMNSQLSAVQRESPLSERRILITTDFDAGVLLFSATLRTGTRTFASGK